MWEVAFSSLGLLIDPWESEGFMQYICSSWNYSPLNYLISAGDTLPLWVSQLIMLLLPFFILPSTSSPIVSPTLGTTQSCNVPSSWCYNFLVLYLSPRSHS